MSLTRVAVVLLILLLSGALIYMAVQNPAFIWIVLVNIGFVVYVFLYTYRTRGRKPLTSPEPQPVKEAVKIPCSQCGTLIPIEAVKCPDCGAPLGR